VATSAPGRLGLARQWQWCRQSPPVHPVHRRDRVTTQGGLDGGATRGFSCGSWGTFQVLARVSGIFERVCQLSYTVPRPGAVGSIGVIPGPGMGTDWLQRESAALIGLHIPDFSNLRITRRWWMCYQLVGEAVKQGGSKASS